MEGDLGLLLCSKVRIVLSPDDSFTRDGKGPTTGIMWIDDFNHYLYILMSIWDEDSGQVIASEWNKNVFPKAARQNGPSSSSTAVANTAPPLAPHGREAANQIIARHREARAQREQNEEEVPFTCKCSLSIAFL